MFRGLLVVLLLLLGSGCSQRVTPDPVLIGMLQALSGPNREQGQAARQATQLALEGLQSNEVRIGGRELTILHTDAGSGLRTVRAETVRLLAVNRTSAVIGVLNPEMGEAFLREARLLSAPALLAGELATPPSGDGLLALGAGPVARADAMARFIRDDLKLKRLGIVLDERDPVAVNLGSALARRLRNSPALPCLEYRFNSTTARESILKQAIASQPEAIVLALPGDVQPAVLQQLRDLGFTGPTFDGGADEVSLPPAPRSTPSHYRVTVYAGTDLTATGQTFVRTYRERFGVDPSLSAVLSWEAVRLVGETMSKNNTSSSLRLREQFGQNPKYEGITGPVEFHDQQAVRKLFVVKEDQGKQTTERVFSPGE